MNFRGPGESVASKAVRSKARRSVRGPQYPPGVKKSKEAKNLWPRSDCVHY